MQDRRDRDPRRRGAPERRPIPPRRQASTPGRRRAPSGSARTRGRAPARRGRARRSRSACSRRCRRRTPSAQPLSRALARPSSPRASSTPAAITPTPSASAPRRLSPARHADQEHEHGRDAARERVDEPDLAGAQRQRERAKKPSSNAAESAMYGTAAGLDVPASAANGAKTTTEMASAAAVAASVSGARASSSVHAACRTAAPSVRRTAALLRTAGSQRRQRRLVVLVDGSISCAPASENIRPTALSSHAPRPPCARRPRRSPGGSRSARAGRSSRRTRRWSGRPAAAVRRRAGRHRCGPPGAARWPGRARRASRSHAPRPRRAHGSRTDGWQGSRSGDHPSPSVASPANVARIARRPGRPRRRGPHLRHRRGPAARGRRVRGACASTRAARSRCSDHLDRLRHSCEGLRLDADHDALEAELAALLEANGAADGLLRVVADPRRAPDPRSSSRSPTARRSRAWPRSPTRPAASSTG